MTVALIAVVSMTFTACGGDSDDGLKTAPGDNGQGGVTSSNIEYIVPCLQLGYYQGSDKTVYGRECMDAPDRCR